MGITGAGWRTAGRCGSEGPGADIQQDLAERTVSLGLERYISDASRRFSLHVDDAWADIPVPLAQARVRNLQARVRQGATAVPEAPTRRTVGRDARLLTAASSVLKTPSKHSKRY